MSESPDVDDESTTLHQVADAFGTTLDPLAAFENEFEGLGIDPFKPFSEDVLEAQNLHADTRRNYRSVFADWTDHMERTGRHPACPSDAHVVQFIEVRIITPGRSKGSYGNSTEPTSFGRTQRHSPIRRTTTRSH